MSVPKKKEYINDHSSIAHNSQKNGSDFNVHQLLKRQMWYFNIIEYFLEIKKEQNKHEWILKMFC